MEKFGYQVQNGNAGANLKKFEFEIGITGYPLGYWVTGCPDVVILKRFSDVPWLHTLDPRVQYYRYVRWERYCAHGCCWANLSHMECVCTAQLLHPSKIELGMRTH